MSVRRDLVSTFPDKRNALALDAIMKLLEPTGDDTAITAKAGGGQSSATRLRSDVMCHEVTTVATAADSVALPAALPGEMHFVKNSGANAMQVFGVGTDTIDSVATGTGISQGAGEGELYYCLIAGNYVRLRGVGTSETFANLTLTGNLALSATNAITAFATGGQASAVALTTDLNRITVCATDGDSVKLPAATVGRDICVANFGAKKADVFPATGDAINSLAANLAVRQNSGTVVWYTCQVAGTWAAQLDVPNAKFTTRALSSSTANAGDLTGARVVTLTNTGATPGNLTTRTGAQMISDGFYTVGDSYILRIVNGQGTGTLTLVAGDGNVTLTGTMTMAINTFRDFVVTITGAATLTIQNIGTGSFS